VGLANEDKMPRQRRLQAHQVQQRRTRATVECTEENETGSRETTHTDVVQKHSPPPQQMQRDLRVAIAFTNGQLT
jgi:hypothetical protein